MKSLFYCFLLTAAVMAGAADFEIKIENSSKNGWVKKGEQVQVKATVLKDGKPISRGYTLRVSHWIDGKPAKGYTVAAEKCFSGVLSLENPGWSYLHFILRDTAKNNARVMLKGRQSASGTGIMLDPYKIQPSRPEPVDFDVFWNANKAELTKVPLKVLEKKAVSINASTDKNIACYDMKIACAGPKPVSGYLCVPRNGKRKYPVILNLAGAGVGSSAKVFYPDMISFSINAHGIANGEKPGFYTALANGELKNYPRIGEADRNRIYFKYMFLRVLRALEYLKTVPEWNGKDIIVRGSSQGGAQTLFAAAMDKDVTLAVAAVPAMCDISGCLASPVRRSGWPKPYGPAKADMAKWIAWDYYDCVNFARRITCPIYISTGFNDATCPPSSVFCMFNQLKSQQKHIETHRDMGHVSRNDAGNAAINKVRQKASKK